MKITSFIKIDVKVPLTFHVLALIPFPRELTKITCYIIMKPSENWLIEILSYHYYKERMNYVPLKFVP